MGEIATTTLALVFHELGTNSIKYGSLARADGKLEICAALDDQDLLIVWTERGGPAATFLKDRSGFGMKLIQQSLTSQLGGSAAFLWEPEGLTAVLRVSRSKIMS